MVTANLKVRSFFTTTSLQALSAAATHLGIVGNFMVGANLNLLFFLFNLFSPVATDIRRHHIRSCRRLRRVWGLRRILWLRRI